jgi:ubiquinone/menaquinone biosynthesis C-methylase UbiE
MSREEASRWFTRGASDYEQARPSYPRAVVDLLVDEFELGPGRSVCDLAAGTGKLTRLLVAEGAEVVAVEPVASMRDQLVAAVPDVEAVDGTAESIPLPPESVDLVTVAQAFHWFDATAALAEFARVLRPDGALVIIWNVRDESVDWVRRFTELIIERTDGIPYRRDYTFDHWAVQVADTHRYTALAHARFDNPQPTDVDLVVSRAASTSYVSDLPDDRRAALLEELRAMLVAHPDVPDDDPFVFPHETDVYWCRRLP